MSKWLFFAKSFAAKIFCLGFQYLPKLLLSTIVALLVVSTAHGAGPLRVNATNSRYFFDSNGTPVYLAGTYLGHEQIELGTKDFITYLDFLQQQKHNFTRLWAWEQSPLTAKSPLLTLPYERTGPGLALDGGAKFDLRRLNQQYFDQLRARVMEASQRGVYVSVVLFQSLNSQSKTKQDNPWYANPFHRDNNVNRIDGDTNGDGLGDESFTLTIPAITSLQEAYIRKVVDTLNDLDNVLYEISGDAPLGNSAWQSYIVSYLKSYQATKLNQHPVGIDSLSGTNIDGVLNSPADWVAFYGADLNPPMAVGGKVLFLEVNLSLLSDSSSHQSVWKSFTRGFNVIDKEPDSLTPAVTESLHAAITQSLAYSQIVNLSTMAPSDIVCSTGYCLAKPGSEYLVYLPSGGRATVDLSASPQKFSVTWFDTTTGQTVAGNSVSGGGQATLTSPFKGETLLHLLVQPQALSPVTTTTTSTTGTVSTSTTTVNTSNTSTATNLSTSFSASSTTINSKKTTVSTPAITPDGGAFAGSISVSLTDNTPGVTIYYTVDGSSPTQSSTKYSAPISVSTDALLKAKAFKNNANPSSEASAWFSKTSGFDFALNNSGNLSVVPGASVSNTISATLASGSTQAVSFSVSGLPSGATGSFSSASCSPNCSTVLNIATSGSTPAGTFSVTVGSTGGGLTRTTVFTLTVVAPIVVSTAATPTITPNGGSFTNPVSVTMATATLGAAIYYSTDGSSPTQLYTGPMTLSNSAIVKAKAFKSGYNPSTEASAGFTISNNNSWTFCSYESAQCNFSGSKLVRYGANGVYAIGIFSDGVFCDNSIFGDPLLGTGKQCEYTNVPDGWIFCSNESNQCNFPGTKLVRYGASGAYDGASGAYAYGMFTDGVFCDNSIFGDPLFGTPKECDYVDTSSLPFDFSVVNSGDLSVTPGSSVTGRITASLVSGSSQAVAFSLSGLPSGATASFSSASCIPSCSTVLTISTSGTTPSGNFPIRVTSTGGGVTRTTTFTLSVTLAFTVATPTITPNGGTFATSVSVALQSATSGSTIYYTMDGSTPTQTSPLYSGLMTLTNNTTIKAAAFKSGYNPSAAAAATFTNSVTSNQTGRVYYVAKTGSDSNSCSQAQSQSTPKLTINGGLSCLTSGDTLLIRAGTYAEYIDTWNGSNLPSGSDWAHATTIAAYPLGCSRGTLNGPGASCDVVRIAPSGIHTGFANVLGIKGDVSYVIFDGLIFDSTNFGGELVSGGTQYGINLVRYDWNTTAPHHTRIINSEITQAKCIGISVAAGSHDHEWSHNKIHTNGYWELTHPDLNNGLVACHGIYVSGFNNLIDSNEINDTPGWGVHIYHYGATDANNNIVRNNYVHDNGFSRQGGVGILLGSGTGNTAYRNIVTRSNMGVQLDYGSINSVVYNNTIYNNVAQGSSPGAGPCIGVGKNAAGVIIKNNICWQNPAGNIMDSGSGTAQSNNLVGVDPMFVNSATDNFHLQSGSPAIDVGTSTISTGISVSPFNGSAPDSGAFEY